jgi:hypothetical protein
MIIVSLVLQSPFPEDMMQQRRLSGEVNSKYSTFPCHQVVDKVALLLNSPKNVFYGATSHHVS